MIFTLPNAVSCGCPSPPANGTIEPYSSTQEGAVLQFHCDEGHTPREWMTSQCQESGSWMPDPALLNCTIGMSTQRILQNKLCQYIISVNCGLPYITLNASLTFFTTTYNSTASYKCRGELIPISETYTAVCTSTGKWEPDAITLECREPGLPAGFL